MSKKLTSVGFDLSLNQATALMDAFSFCEKIYDLNWEDAFMQLFSYSFPYFDGDIFLENWKEQLHKMMKYMMSEEVDDFNTIQKPYHDKLVVLQKKFDFCKSIHELDDQPKHPIRYKFLVDLTDDELRMLADVLDLPYRIACGQWEHLRTCLAKMKTTDGNDLADYCITSDSKIDEYKSKIVHVYDKFSSSYGVSYGIMNEELNDKHRVIYDIYKTFMYEYNCHGVHGSAPYKTENSNDKMPGVSLPLTYITTFNGDDIGMEKLLNESTTNPDRKIKRFNDAPRMLFVPVKERVGTLYVGLQNDDKIYQRVNGYYVVIHKGEKVPSQLEVFDYLSNTGD